MGRASRARRWTRTLSAVSLAVSLAAVCTACGTVREGVEDLEDAAPKPPASTAAPGDGEARRLLAELDVRQPGTMDGYSRDRFAHWSDQEGACDTREVVLKRDGKDVRTDADCSAVSGTWHSPYDAGVWTDASDVDVDHMVPLAEAWRSGARAWDDERREAFANDLERPQLWAVTDNVNQSKGDEPPDEWKPERRSYWCTYAGHWVAVKHHYALSVTEAEKTALTSMLRSCGE
ncbi:HNH endonuclease [Streptomyces sp. RKND-216]|nr:HNH endonuclease [Streptomyces sp. RKND-216]